MARINLLPWRAERQKERKKQFFTMLALSAVAGFAVWFAVDYYYDAQISGQQERNAFEVWPCRRTVRTGASCRGGTHRVSPTLPAIAGKVSAVSAIPWQRRIEASRGRAMWGDARCVGLGQAVIRTPGRRWGAHADRTWSSLQRVRRGNRERVLPVLACRDAG